MKSNQTLPKNNRFSSAEMLRRLNLLPRWLLGAMAVALIALIPLVVIMVGGRSDADYMKSTYLAKKMDLDITVLEGGNIVSDKPDRFASEVQGRTAILDIVPDGYVITQEDVDNKKVLVQMDASTLTERATSQEITVQSAESAYKQAEESFEIQKKQNESNITAGELKVKFTWLDFEKYVGAKLAEAIRKNPASITELFAGVVKQAEDADAVEESHLGGESLQTWRKLRANIGLAGEELARAKTKYESSQSLAEVGYVAKTDVEADRLALLRRRLDLDQAELDLRIFVQYEFPKQVEKLYSDYNEAVRELDRVKARARAEAAKAEADLNSRRAQLKLQSDTLEKYRTQLSKTQIVAPRPGVVVYSSSSDIVQRFRNPIMQGGTVYERQIIFIIPDPENMAVDVKVHESTVNKIAEALKVAAANSTSVEASIVLDAFPDITLYGRVIRVADMPDNSNVLASPDVKFYSTMVKIDKPPAFLKTGMSAKVEIFIAMRKDAIVVPIQAVATVGSKRICYVMNGGRAVLREVKAGESNDKFIEVSEGLEEGERVLMHPLEMLEEKRPQALMEEQEEGQALPATEVPKSDETSTTPEGAAIDRSPDATVPADASADKPETPEFDIDSVLSRVPADRREEWKQRWEAATPEERDAMIKRLREGPRRRSGNRQRSTESND